jgi:hypothetical protein
MKIEPKENIPCKYCGTPFDRGYNQRCPNSSCNKLNVGE